MKQEIGPERIFRSDAVKVIILKNWKNTGTSEVFFGGRQILASEALPAGKRESGGIKARQHFCYLIRRSEMKSTPRQIQGLNASYLNCLGAEKGFIPPDRFLHVFDAA